ncbi:hypothetical protein CR513_23969, partial [Mucuna pruriens]
MTTNYNIIWSSLKLNEKLDFIYWKVLLFTHLRVHNIWNFIEFGLLQGSEESLKIKTAIFCKENMKDLVNKKRIHGEDITNNKVVDKILHTMPIKFDHVVTTIRIP